MYQIDDIVNKIHCADCLKFLKEIPDKSISLILTDPPYGIGKAEWDTIYPMGFEKECLRIGKTVAIMCGQWAIPDCIKALGGAYVGIIAARNKNGMTFSPLGFGNWIPVIIAGDRPKSGQDFLSFSVTGDMPKHPSPKPIACMTRLVGRLSEIADLILDPFAGSGTTCVAAKMLGRRYIGIEISPEYCKIAEQRIANTGIQAEMGFDKGKGW